MHGSDWAPRARARARHSEQNSSRVLRASEMKWSAEAVKTNQNDCYSREGFTPRLVSPCKSAESPCELARQLIRDTQVPRHPPPRNCKVHKKVKLNKANTTLHALTLENFVLQLKLGVVAMPNLGSSSSSSSFQLEQLANINSVVSDGLWVL